ERVECEVYLGTGEDAGNVIAAALRTPPYNIVLSLVAPGHSVEQVTALFAADTHMVYETLPGVLAPSAVSRAFCDEWQRLTRQSYRLALSEGIYPPPPPEPGPQTARPPAPRRAPGRGHVGGEDAPVRRGAPGRGGVPA